MYRTALALTSAALMLLTTASPAAAEEHEFTVNACDSVLTFEELKGVINEKLGETTYAASGNLVFRISDEDSSVVVRLPGRVSSETTGNIVTVTQHGRSLVFADAESGLPELALIVGTVVEEVAFDLVTGDFISAEITSVKGRVVDVCELLAR
jgi:hypothetical protein